MRRGPAGESEEMSSLEDVELECAGERIEHRVRWADLAGLEPLDVVDAHGGQRGDFFAPQPLDAPAAAGSESDVFGPDPCAS